jgi:hypothetical protein
MPLLRASDSLRTLPLTSPEYQARIRHFRPLSSVIYRLLYMAETEEEKTPPVLITPHSEALAALQLLPQYEEQQKDAAAHLMSDLTKHKRVIHSRKTAAAHHQRHIGEFLRRM